MSITILCGIIIALFLALLFVGVPVFMSMLICGAIGCVVILGDFKVVLAMGKDSFINTYTNYTISVAPMFILMGELASESGIGGNLFSSFRVILGRLGGSLATSVQVACAIFGAICGVAAATCGMMSRVAYPEMKKAKYKDELSAGTIGSGCSLAVLIPPSLPLITYGASTQTSIGQLFIGGIFVGIILMVAFIIVIQIWCRKDPLAGPRGERTTMKQKWQAVKDGSVIEIILVFAISLIGMFTGWFTPTEAGAIGSILMLILVIVKRRFSWKMLVKSLEGALILSGMIYCLLVGTNLFGMFFTLSRLSNTLGAFFTSINISGIVLVLIIAVILFIAGCFMDAMSVVLVTAPILLPILLIFGYSPVWYGVFAVLMTGVAAITPPVGLSCFIVSGITKIPLMTAFKGSGPFLIAFFVIAVIMAIFPEVATWLPSKFFG